MMLALTMSLALSAVPQLYVRVKPGDLDGSGSLLSADTINMNLTGDLNNTDRVKKDLIDIVLM